ncbi:MAG TPA: hypothetical protein VHD38_00045 [Candidatus Paceibacterota bacterium]|nr:hypothetical protein [Candidatus Paceibacterota bacterium]
MLPLQKAVLIYLLGAAICIACTLYFSNDAGAARIFSSLSPCVSGISNSAQMTDCVERAVPTLFARDLSAGEIIHALSSADAPEQLRDACHPIGHIVGAQTYRSHGSIEAALRTCTSDCRGACTHGVIGAGILAEIGRSYDEADVAHADLPALQKIAQSLCATSGRSVCHAIGHLFYLATSDMNAALALCDANAEPANREFCYNGVFMESTGSPSFALNPAHPVAALAPAAADRTYPCMQLRTPYRHACFTYLMAFQLPLFTAAGIARDDMLSDMERACTALGERDRAYCFEGLGTAGIAFGFGSTDATRAQGFCEQFDGNNRDACTLGVVEEFALGGAKNVPIYCESITETGRRSLCFNALFQFSTHPFDTQQTVCTDDATCSAYFDSYRATQTTLPQYSYGLYGK